MILKKFLKAKPLAYENLAERINRRTELECHCDDPSWGTCPEHGRKKWTVQTKDGEPHPTAVLVDVVAGIASLKPEAPSLTAACGKHQGAFKEDDVTGRLVHAAPNPKTLMGRLKVPMFSVVPPASIIGEAQAMQYGAFEAPRADGTKGYGPYNWREQDIEAMTYVDAAMRHMACWVDGEDLAQDSMVHHLKHAKASLGILLDAIENKTVIDNRPSVRKNVAAQMFEKAKKEAK